MAHSPADLVQRKTQLLSMSVDSVLIDDARTPLIISGPVPQEIVMSLKPKNRKLVSFTTSVGNRFFN
jgi:preprotein translocase subunit SecA